MSDDLRAAAKRLARDDADDRRGDLGEADLFDRLRDGGRLARAWLADHPADDGVAVTADWLASEGWELHDSRPGWRRWKKTILVQDHGHGLGHTTHWLAIHEPQIAVDGTAWWPIEFWQQHQDTDEPQGVALLSWVDHTTRGHVRRLLAALGLTPPPPG